MSVPAVVIRLEYERAPVVYSDCVGEAEATRLGDWLREAHPEYGELAARALDLAEEAKAA